MYPFSLPSSLSTSAAFPKEKAKRALHRPRGEERERENRRRPLFAPRLPGPFSFPPNYLPQSPSVGEKESILLFLSRGIRAAIPSLFRAPLSVSFPASVPPSSRPPCLQSGFIEAREQEKDDSIKNILVD